MQGVASSSVSWPWMCLTTSQVTLVSVATPVAVTSSPTGVQAASSGAEHEGRTKGRNEEGGAHGRARNESAARRSAGAGTSLERRRKKILSTPRARVREDCRRTACARRNTLCRPFQGVQSATRGGAGRGRIQSARRRAGGPASAKRCPPTPLGRHAGAFVLSLLLAVAGPARDARGRFGRRRSRRRTAWS